MSRIEIHIRCEKDAPDWESMGIKKPKNYKPEVVYKRRLMLEDDVEYIEEYSDEETTLKITGYEATVIVKGGYEEVATLLCLPEDPEDLVV